MKFLIDPKRKVRLHIAGALVVVLLFLSSRTPILSPLSLVYDGKRPRPSKQSLPTHSVRVATDQDMASARDDAHPKILVESPHTSGVQPALSRASHLHLRTETTKPKYLQFFRTTGVQNHLSPPA